MRIYLLLCLLIFSCKAQVENIETEATEPQKFQLPAWAKDAVIYEVNTRQFTPEGTFNALADHLPRIQKMGVDILWLMPIHPISELKRKAKGDLLVSDIKDPKEREQYHGSPYAVADYKKVNPKYGTAEDFKSLVNKAHSLGMKLIVDWVPNHTGWDNPWITDHPEWFTQDSLGNIIDPIDYNTGKSWGWTDVADLNYDNKDMREEMIQSMEYWITDFDVDGFRVDVAHGVPQDFWDEWTPRMLAKKKDIFLLAEGEVPSNRNEECFHVDYGWTFHHLMREIVKEEKGAEDIDAYFTQDSSRFKKGLHMHFTSNHDENTWAGTVFERLGDGHAAFAALTFCLDGMPLIYGGQEEPLYKRLEFFKKDDIEFKDYEYQDFYTKLCDMKSKNKAIWNGEYGGSRVKYFDHDKIYAFKREKDGNVVIGLFNLSHGPAMWDVHEDINMKELIGSRQMDYKKGTRIQLQPWEYYILSNNG